MRVRGLFAAYGAALGALFAWGMVILLAYGRPELYVIEVFAATGVVGAAFGAIAGAVGSSSALVVEKTPRFRQVRRFLRFAAAAWFGHVIVVATVGSVARREFALQNWQLAVFLAVFGAIGIVAGLASSRYREIAAEREMALRVAQERQRAADELDMARQLQQQLLPLNTFDGDGFGIRARVMPARYVAGDFYDYMVSPGYVGFCIADVAGKGAAAGLLMATTKAMLSMLPDPSDPAAVLTALNEQLCGTLRARQFVALLYGVFSPSTGRVLFANAGMPDPFRMMKPARTTAVEATGERLPLGLRRHRGYQNVETFLEPGDRLACFSDGLPEVAGGDGDVLGYERLRAIFNDAASLESDDAVVDAVFTRVGEHVGTELGDDCTLLVLARRPPA